MIYLGECQSEDIGETIESPYDRYQNYIAKRTPEGYQVYGTDLEVSEIELALKGEHLEREH